MSEFKKNGVVAEVDDRFLYIMSPKLSNDINYNSAKVIFEMYIRQKGDEMLEDLGHDV